MRLTWLLLALVLALVLAGVHIYAVEHFLYWKYRWFDTPMHMLGGAAIGTFTVALIGPVWRPWHYLAAVAIVFIGWEVFEAAAGIAVLPGVNYTWDTAHDILNDVLGATAVYIIARFTAWKPVSP
jgi:hypothetical protein